MKLNNFPTKINKIILDRGRTLFEGNKVEYLETMPDGTYFNVYGNKLYVVGIALDNDMEIKDLICGCPYFSENGICKHSVAALYYYCKMLKITPYEKQMKDINVFDEADNFICKARDYDFKILFKEKI